MYSISAKNENKKISCKCTFKNPASADLGPGRHTVAAEDRKLNFPQYVVRLKISIFAYCN
jgi:hypothetical protein